jgi:hypothetical protein
MHKATANDAPQTAARKMLFFGGLPPTASGHQVATGAFFFFTMIVRLKLITLT